MTTDNNSSAFALPPGCIVRPATFRDLWQLLKLPFAPARNRNLQTGINSLKTISTVTVITIYLLGLICSFSYVVSNQIGKFLISKIPPSGSVIQDNSPEKLVLRILFLLYGKPNSFTISEDPNLLGAILAFLLTLVLVSPIAIAYLRQTYLNTWVVECDRRIVGAATVIQGRQSSYLRSIYVVPTYRRQGIGSFLVRYIIGLRQPVYLVCCPQLVTFYIRLGFIQVSQHRNPISSWAFGSIPMVTANTTSTVSTQAEATTPANLLIHECTIRRAQARDIWKIRRLLFVFPNMDFFLPFGISSSLLISLILLSWLLPPLGMLLLVLIAAITNIIIANVLAFKLLLIWLAWGLIATIIVPIISVFLATFWGSQNFSRFWLLEHHNKLIGYARLSSARRYSILKYLYITVSTEQHNLSIYLLQHILQEATKPIYVACTIEAAKLYTDVGFTSMPVQSLPKKLRFGAQISLRFGGINLAYSSNA